MVIQYSCVMKGKDKIQEIHAAWLKELAEISPFLSGISKSHPWKVPKGYFETLSESTDWIHSSGNQAEIKEIPKDHKEYGLPQNYFDQLAGRVIERIDEQEFKLEQYGKETGFRVPEGYFTHLQETLFSRINETVPSTGKTGILRRIDFRIAIPAAAAVIAGIVFLGIMFFDQTEPDSFSMDNVSQAELDLYFASHIEQYDLEDLYPLLDEDSEAILDNELFNRSGIDVDLLEDYIINEIDIGLLEEDLL